MAGGGAALVHHVRLDDGDLVVSRGQQEGKHQWQSESRQAADRKQIEAMCRQAAPVC